MAWHVGHLRSHPLIMYTASSVFLKTLADAGITHVFVNWGSDHPGMLEELALRSQDGKYGGMKIITCLNEMTGLSAAQGFAQVTGKPAALIVHVDVGTQVRSFSWAVRLIALIIV